MLKKHKNILFILIALIVLFFGYWYFFLSKKDVNTEKKGELVLNTNAATASTPQNSYDREFVSNLQTVRYIDLNVEIFSKAAYKALAFPETPFAVDYNIPVGRRNPFLPIGKENTPDIQPAQVDVPAPAEVVPAATTTPVPTTLKPKPVPVVKSGTKTR